MSANDVDSLRLTPRGRFCVRIVLIVTGVLAMLGGVSPATASAEPTPRQIQVVVQEGDTLSDLLARHTPQSTGPSAIREVIRLNHLDGAKIYAGQQLTLVD